MNPEKNVIRGADVLKRLAGIYPQLYLTPGPEGAAAYKKTVESGEMPEKRSLSHFRCSADDLLTDEIIVSGEGSCNTLWWNNNFLILRVDC